jgi:copper(I)-binding protein
MKKEKRLQRRINEMSRLKKQAAFLIAFLFIFQISTFTKAADSNPTITSYSVEDSSGSAVTMINKDDTVDITLEIEDSGINASQLSSENDIDVSIASGGFSGGTISKTITSSGSDLSYSVTLSDVTYDGSDNKLSLDISYNNLSISSEASVTISEGIVYDEETPSYNDSTGNSNNTVVTAPYVVVSRSDMTKPIEAGQKINLTVFIKNIGTTAMRTVLVNFSSSDSINIVDDTSTAIITQISKGSTAKIKLSIQANNTIASATQTISMDIKYNYDNGTSMDENTLTEQVTIPSKIKESIPQPNVIMSISDFSHPIKAGEKMTFDVYFKNIGQAKIESPIVTFTPSDSLILNGGKSAYQLPNISVGKTVSTKITVTGGNAISSPNQSLTGEIKFSYDSGNAIVQASSEEKVIIPAKTKSKESMSEPTIIVTRNSINKPISAGEAERLTLTFENAGKTKAISPVAVISTSDGLILENNTSTFVLGDIEPGKSQSIPVNIKAGKEITSSTQSVTAELKFSYDSGDAIAQASTTEHVNISANTSSTDSPVPNIIVSNFEFGGDSVAAGGKFPLTFSFKNTGKLPIENIVATVDAGENFAMDGATNTYFYNSLGAGAELSQKIPMQVIPAAKTGAQTIGISFKYEYVDGSKRSSSTADVKISIPIYQPDRFEIDLPQVDGEAMAGQEVSISLPYVNKSKSDIYNVEAEIEGDVDTLVKTQNLGNFEAGKSGSIGFVVIPSEGGEMNFSLKVTYEDSNQEVKTKEFPVTLQVQEPAPVDDGAEDEPAEEPSSVNPTIIILICILAVVAAGIIIFIKKRKAAKKAAELDDIDDIDDEFDDYDNDDETKESERK